MAGLDWHKLQLGTPIYGNLPAAPTVPGSATEKQAGLALDTNSSAITGPCEICVVSDAKARIDFAATTGALAPATSGLTLQANVERYFTLKPGTWFLKATAWS